MPGPGNRTKLDHYFFFAAQPGFYNFARVAPTTTQVPITAIKVNEALKVAIPAIKPITGGPIKKPTKPIVETAARETPGDMVVDFPAAL